jgi:hypothetical protein
VNKYEILKKNRKSALGLLGSLLVEGKKAKSGERK